MTITINKIQYAKNEVLRMVMTRAHRLAKINHNSSFSWALKAAWDEVKRQIASMWINRKMDKAEYADMSTEQKLEWVSHKLFHINMNDTYAVWANNRGHDYLSSVNRVRKLENEQARLMALLAA